VRRETFARVLASVNAVRPFQPFTVELVNGVRYVARSSEVVILDGDVASFTDIDGAEEYFDATSVVRVVPHAIPPGAK